MSTFIHNTSLPDQRLTEMECVAIAENFLQWQRNDDGHKWSNQFSDSEPLPHFDVEEYGGHRIQQRFDILKCAVWSVEWNGRAIVHLDWVDGVGCNRSLIADGRTYLAALSRAALLWLELH